MSQIIHNTSFPNDGLGDPLREAFGNQNTMNTELYTTKVDVVFGKGLTSNDFTNALKAKLDAIASGAEVNVQPDWNQLDDTQDNFIKNKPEQLFATAVSFKFIQKGFGNSNLAINEIGDIFCGWSNDGTKRIHEATWNGGALTDSDNFTPLIQTEI